MSNWPVGRLLRMTKRLPSRPCLGWFLTSQTRQGRTSVPTATDVKSLSSFFAQKIECSRVLSAPCFMKLQVHVHTCTECNVVNESEALVFRSEWVVSPPAGLASTVAAGRGRGRSRSVGGRFGGFTDPWRFGGSLSWSQ